MIINFIVKSLVKLIPFSFLYAKHRSIASSQLAWFSNSNSWPSSVQMCKNKPYQHSKFNNFNLYIIWKVMIVEVLAGRFCYFWIDLAVSPYF